MSSLRERLMERLTRACPHFQDDPECAEFIAEAMEAIVRPVLDAKDAENERVRALHRRETIPLRYWQTEGCAHCRIATWPCPTIAALDGTETHSADQ